MHGLKKSQGKFSLMVLGYNFTRVLSVLGLGAATNASKKNKTVILGYA